jgi:ubiquinone biosynthesis monooxygenase Coq7
MRAYSVMDTVCLKADKLLRFLSGHLSESEQKRKSPSHSMTETKSLLSEGQVKQVAGFMRVNYTGEVCAQALYQGQALTTKNVDLKLKLEKAGLEEQDHLYWCQSRIHDLNSHVSYLNPLFYGGSLLLGMAAGAFGDEWNLGFLEETENQVVKHLEVHLKNLPEQDTKTRVILETMILEEQSHADTAKEAGAKELPFLVKKLMNLSSKIMTKTTYWI